MKPELDNTEMITLKKLIDLTKLDLTTTFAEAKEIADKSLAEKLNSACIRPSHVRELMDLHKPYRLSAVLGFPKLKYEIASDVDLQQSKANIGRVEKSTEAQQALTDGALELDPVMNIGNLKNLEKELKNIVQVLFAFALQHPHDVFWCKPIFSCELLNDKELEETVKIFSNVVNSFYEQHPEMQEQIKFAYKNSTGFVISKSDSGFKLRTTSPELITMITELLNKYDPQKNFFIKAAGGIRDIETAVAIKAAAQGRLSHIGTSKNFLEEKVVDSY